MLNRSSKFIEFINGDSAFETTILDQGELGQLSKLIDTRDKLEEALEILKDICSDTVTLNILLFKYINTE